MTQYNPYKNTFDKSKKYSKCAEITLWISTILIIIAFVIKEFYPTLNKISEGIIISDHIIKLNCFFTISFAVLSFISEMIFYKASVQRREDFIDNSFKTILAEKRSKEYYTNDDINSGIYKLAVNSFENSLFTYNIAQKMTAILWIKNIICAILTLIFSIYGYSNAFILSVQLVLPILLLQQAIKHTLFVYRIKRVFEDNRRLFNDLKNKKDSKSKRPEIVLNVLNYETTLTFGAIILDSRIYNKMNSSLSDTWNELKLDYNIKKTEKCH